MQIFRVSLLLLGLVISSVSEAASEPLAEVDGVVSTPEEVEKPLAAQLGKLEEQIYHLKRQRLDALINDKLLEKEESKRKITVPALLNAEVTGKVGLVTEQEIEKFYQDNKAQIKVAQAEAREKIRAFLQNQKLAASDLLSRLRAVEDASAMAVACGAGAFATNYSYRVFAHSISRYRVAAGGSLGA